MNFYLSAVDDLLRRSEDQPSLGLILCKERNKLVVEYALRDMSKPMGVAEYRLTQALPERLKSELPTNEDLAAELPLLDLLTLRIQLERRLAELAKAHGLEWERENIGMLVTNLHLSELIPTEMLHSIMVLSETLNRAVHGEKMTTEEAQRSLETGKVGFEEIGTLSLCNCPEVASEQGINRPRHSCLPRNRRAWLLAEKAFVERRWVGKRDAWSIVLLKVKN